MIFQTRGICTRKYVHKMKMSSKFSKFKKCLKKDIENFHIRKSNQISQQFRKLCFYSLWIQRISCTMLDDIDLGGYERRKDEKNK